MRLIKDLVDHRIVYYWTVDAHRISPIVSTMAEAEEWFIKFHHEAYMGEERRNSHIDRRRLYTKRDKLRNTEFIPTSPLGRRVTDKPVKVDQDLSKEKMAKLIEIYKKLEDNE